jgi:hypothetical protein
MRSLFD